MNANTHVSALNGPPPREPQTTEETAYAERLVRLQTPLWKRVLSVQAPYAWNLRRLQPGFLLEIGCGIGRCLEHVRGEGVGIDHNPDCVAACRQRGFQAFTPAEFTTSAYHQPGRFDTLLAAHVAEHLPHEEFVTLLRSYLPLLRQGGQVILITPQERGYASDPTHVQFVDFASLAAIATALGWSVERQFSFPFGRWAGGLFKYNEFVAVLRHPEQPASPA